MSRLLTVWDDGYHTDAAPTISTTKQRAVVERANAEGLIRPVATPFDLELTYDDIARVHDNSYARAVQTGEPRMLAESQGFKWSKDFATSVAKIWNGHVFACKLALEHQVVMHPVSGAHHADRKHGGGFCTFNFLVGAADALLRANLIDRVMIIDLDAHQGDGTLRMVGEDERYSLFDITHQPWVGLFESPRLYYRQANTGRQYLQMLQTRLPEYLDRFKPQLVQFQAGMDCHESDFMGGIRGLNAGLLAARDRFVVSEVFHRRIPLVINLAGGYNTDGTTEYLHVQTFREARAVVNPRIVSLLTV